MSHEQDSGSLERFEFKLARGPKAKAIKARLGPTFRIGRYDYKITLCSRVVLGGREAQGLCDCEAKALYIVVDEEFYSTLLHEVVHAVVAEGGFRQAPGWDLTLEEILCEQISSTLAELL